MADNLVLSADATAVIRRRFSNRIRDVERLLQVNETLRTICEDLAQVEQVMSSIDQVPEALRESRYVECLELIEALTSEVEEALAQAKIIQFPGTRDVNGD